MKIFFISLDIPKKVSKDYYLTVSLIWLRNITSFHIDPPQVYREVLYLKNTCIDKKYMYRCHIAMGISKLKSRLIGLRLDYCCLSLSD